MASEEAKRLNAAHGAYKAAIGTGGERSAYDRLRAVAVELGAFGGKSIAVAGLARK